MKDYKIVNISIVGVIMIYVLCLFKQYVIDGYPFYLPYNSDLVRANLPAYTLLYDVVFNSRSFWSWSMGLGTSIVSHADIIFDPFTYITFLLGRDKIAYMMVWSLIIKIVFEGIAFSYYMRFWGVDKYAVIISSVMYSFSGYSLIMGSNLALGTVLVYFPLVMLGVEKKLLSNDGKTLFVSLLLICIYSYYFYYIVGMITFVYLILRCHQLNKSILKNTFCLVKYGFISLLMSAFTILPQVILASESLRANEGKDVLDIIDLFRPHLKQILTFIARSFGLNVLGDNYKIPYYGSHYGDNFGDYFQGEIFVSAYFWLILGQWVYYSNKRIKIIKYFILLCFAIFIPFVSYGFNAFSTVNYRWVFVVHFFCCFGCAYGIDCIIQNRAVHEKTLVLTAFVCSLLCISAIFWVTYVVHFSSDFIYRIYDASLRYYMCIVGGYLFVIFIVRIFGRNIEKSIWNTRAILIVIACMMLGDYYVNYSSWYQTELNVRCFEGATKYAYDDNSNRLIKSISSRDNGFFRIYKTFDSVYDVNSIPSNNDAIVQEYKGIKSYCSFNQPWYLRYLFSLGVYPGIPQEIKRMKDNNIAVDDIKGQQLNYISGVDFDWRLLNLLSVKYVVLDDKDMRELPGNMEQIYVENGMKVYLNKTFLPVVRINDEYINNESFLQLSYGDRMKALEYKTVIDKDMMVNEKSCCRLFTYTEDSLRIKANIKNKEDIIVCSIPFDKGWKVYIDGMMSKPCLINGGMLGVCVSEGEHDIYLKFVPNGLYEGMIVSVLTMLCMGVYWVVKRKHVNYVG